MASTMIATAAPTAEPAMMATRARSIPATERPENAPQSPTPAPATMTTPAPPGRPARAGHARAASPTHVTTRTPAPRMRATRRSGVSTRRSPDARRAHRRASAMTMTLAPSTFVATRTACSRRKCATTMTAARWTPARQRRGTARPFSTRQRAAPPSRSPSHFFGEFWLRRRLHSAVDARQTGHIRRAGLGFRRHTCAARAVLQALQPELQQRHGLSVHNRRDGGLRRRDVTVD